MSVRMWRYLQELMQCEDKLPPVSVFTLAFSDLSMWMQYKTWEKSWVNTWKTMSVLILQKWNFMVSHACYQIDCIVLQALLRLPLLRYCQQVCRGFPREGVRVTAAIRGVPYGVHDALLCVQHYCQQCHASECTLHFGFRLATLQNSWIK